VGINPEPLLPTTPKRYIYGLATAGYTTTVSRTGKQHLEQACDSISFFFDAR
jgi:hypothetical protein